MSKVEFGVKIILLLKSLAKKISKCHQYQFFPVVHDDYTLGESLFWQLSEENALPPYLSYNCINF